MRLQRAPQKSSRQKSAEIFPKGGNRRGHEHFSKPPDRVFRDTGRLRIAVVSEVRFLREGVGGILERDPSVAAVVLCTDLAAAALSPDLRPDLVLLDAALPDGPAAVSRLHDVAPDLRIIALAVRETEEDIIVWAQAGVIGYVPSTAAWADLVRLVIGIQAGEQLSSGRVAAGLFRRMAKAEKISTMAATPYRRHPH